MSASFNRQPPSLRVVDSRWEASGDALDIAEKIRRTAFDLVQHGDTLLDHPADPQVRAAARTDARKMIALCDDLERLASGVSGRVS